ncbi:AIPR family protein [uncultured Algibacter sp.]|uniref:AIPR family protein n=1 Tax=uncultured Algibacter sp. TaxID=298659 RepID=UPI0030EBC993|tara:strand:+ start:5279 stop:7660 length:2382 start_codon:yes stop_codon:yes gene_type:complete
MINQEFVEYSEKAQAEVNIRFNSSDEDGATRTEKFTEYVIDLLSETSELNDASVFDFYYSLDKRDDIDIQINGYSLFEDLDSSKVLDLIITLYDTGNSVHKLLSNEFNKIIKLVSKFANSAIKGHLNEIEPSLANGHVKSLITELFNNRNKYDRINFYFLTNTIVEQKTPQEFPYKGFDQYTVNYHIWDLERLMRLNNSNGKKEPLQIDFSQITDKKISCLAMGDGINNSDYECYLAIMPGQVLCDLYSKYYTRLLESNVRVFLQQTGKINKGIRDTVIKNPKMFLAYNNGLTATADDVVVANNGSLVLKSVSDFQIVNGGQTVASLYYTLKKNKDVSLKDVYVQMKLTVIKDKEKKNSIVPLISRYANSQNKISELDLSSNNKFFQEIERLSRNIFVSNIQTPNIQTSWYFERVKGQFRESLNRGTKSYQRTFKEKNPTSQKFLKSELAKYSNVYLQLPFVVSKGAQKNFVYYVDKVIEKDFNSKNKLPSRIFYEDLIANAIIFRTVDKMFGRKGQNPIGDTNLKAPTVIYSISIMHFLTNGLINLNKIFEEQKVDEILLLELKKIMFLVYKFLIRGEGLVSEKAKKESTWTDLQVEFENHRLPNLELFLISQEIKESRLSAYYAKENDEVEKNANLSRITNIGNRFWDGLAKAKILGLTDLHRRKIASLQSKINSNRLLSSIDIKNGVMLLDLIVEKSIDIESIKEKSNINKDVLTDLGKAINFLKKISEEDWKRIISLGDYKQILTFKDISLIKTIRSDFDKNIDSNPKKIEKVYLAVQKVNEKFKILKK